jgi:hypothetical protein
MEDTGKPRTVRAFFDDYVRRDFPNRRAPDGSSWVWPGDEWVNELVRENTYDLLLRPSAGEVLNEVIEIGPGSGKYTQMLLQRTGARITAYEISDAFLEALAVRCGDFVSNGRLVARPIDFTANEGLVRSARELEGRVDLFFGIDVFLMMDFQSAFVYLLSAALLLRKGGRFAGTFGDADSDSGWERLVRDAGRHSAFDDAPCTRFHWVGRTALIQTLERLGFAVHHMVSGPDAGPQGDLDVARLYVVAEMVDPAAAQALKATLFPA